jgi:hypothetical protein
VPDPETGELVSDAEVAEIPQYTAFASRKKAEQVIARLIVRRVRNLAKPAIMDEQGELFPVWRYHPFFTDQPAATLQAEREHRHHAVVEQVIADTKAGALAHLPSGHFHANAARLTLWATTYNLLRAACALTSPFHAKATTATATTSSRPIVSTITCLFRPVVRLPASNPRASPPSLVLIDWASITTADGSGSRPAPIRSWRRSSSWMRSQLPSRRHLVNQRCAASQGIRSRGSIRHWQPERST